MGKNAKNATFFSKERKRTQECCILLKRTGAQPWYRYICWTNFLNSQYRYFFWANFLNSQYRYSYIFKSLESGAYQQYNNIFDNVVVVATLSLCSSLEPNNVLTTFRPKIFFINCTVYVKITEWRNFTFSFYIQYSMYIVHTSIYQKPWEENLNLKKRPYYDWST